MNKQRRKKLEQLQARLADLAQELQSLVDEEQDYFDNMPESLQQGERGTTAEAAVEAMNTAVGELENAGYSLDDAMNS